MPKEMINFSRTHRMHHNCGMGDVGCVCTPTATVMPGVVVRWGSGGHDKLDISNVQITLLEYEEPSWNAWLETDPYGNSEVAFPTPPIRREVHSAVLSRSEINRMIEVLRRARDAAYGRDE